MMEVFGALFDDEEYESLTKMFDYINPADYFLHESSIFPSDSNFCNNYFEYSCSQTDNNSLHDDHLTSYNNMFGSMSFYDGGYISPDNVMGDILRLNPELSRTDQNVGPEKEIQLKRKYEEESSARDSDCHKKKARISRNVEKNQRGVVHKSKRKKIVADDKNNTSNEESADIGNRKQSLLSGSQEAGSTGLNSEGKARASRGSATDPQSLYARRRRERISERLRILQNLVPNGTKVDISTMLEEAVHYVKFLQLQIKLLSSDDMWMYAPIAYNGMDPGMFHKSYLPLIN